MKSFKTLFCALSFLLIASFSYGQNTGWKQQADFHTVMSQTFHPAEEGNLKPLKSRSAELVSAAKAWKSSAVPATVADEAGVKNNLKKLYAESKDLNKKVKKGASDEVLTADLTAMHNTFHTIVGLCDAKEKHMEH